MHIGRKAYSAYPTLLKHAVSVKELLNVDVVAVRQRSQERQEELREFRRDLLSVL